MAVKALDRSDFYVYVLFRWDGLPFYVGKGRGRRETSIHIDQANIDLIGELLLYGNGRVGLNVPFHDPAIFILLFGRDKRHKPRRCRVEQLHIRPAEGATEFLIGPVIPG